MKVGEILSIVLDIWGDFACFTRSEAKVERLTYPVPTPSAIRGILDAIYSKPIEFYWQVEKIEVINPIRYISFKRNEVKNAISADFKPKVILSDDTDKTNGQRTQRQTVVLKNVYYRITASIIKRETFNGNIKSLYDQAERRIQSGKCYYQPYLGCREFICYFEKASKEVMPINETIDLGFMLYDVFNLGHINHKEDTKPYISLFKAKLEKGIMDIPPFHSDRVLKPSGGDSFAQ